MAGVTRRAVLAGLGAAALGGGARADQVPEFWHYLGAGGELEGVKGLMAVVDKTLGGKVTHRVVPGSAAGLRQQVQVSLMGGVPPIAYQVSAGVEVNQLARSGRLAPIDPAWKKVDGDALFPKGLVQVSSLNGSVYGMPFAMSMLGNVWYNTAIFARLGLKAPSGRDEWDKTCEALKAGGVVPLTSAAGPAWTTYQFYGPLLEALGIEGFWQFIQGKVALTDARLGKAFDLFAAHFVKYFDTSWTGAKWSDGLDRMMKGEVGMYLMGDWASGYMKDRGWTPGKEYDFFQSPGLAGTAIFQSDVMVVLKGDKTALGLDFVAAASDAAAQGAFAKAKGSLSPNRKTDPSIYDALAKREYAIATDPKTTVLPNPYAMMPAGLKEDIGTAIEKFAATRDRAALNKELARLEPARSKALAAGEFATL